MIKPINFYHKVNIFFVLLLIAGAFFVFPPTGDFGDQPTEDILILGKMIEYNEVAFNGSFNDYYRHIWEKYHQEKLDRTNDINGYKDGSTPLSKYGLDERLPGLTGAVGVKALSRLFNIFVYYLTFKLFDLPHVFIIAGFILFLGTYIYAYKFGTEIAGQAFGTILAIIVTCNVYFNQLIRSYMENQTLVYPFLFFFTFYHLLKFHNRSFTRKAIAAVFLGLGIGMTVNNGYPNTTFILLPSLLIFGTVLCIKGKIVPHSNTYQVGKLKDYAILIISTVFFTLGISITWSLLLGQDAFYHLSLVSYRWQTIFVAGGTINATFMQSKSLSAFIASIQNFLKLLWVGTNVYIGPHEPGFLIKQSFFNLIENILFITGILFVLYNAIKKRTVLDLFLLYNLGVMGMRILSDRNEMVSKTSFDYYFLAQLFVAYGMFHVIPKIYYYSSIADNLESLKNVRTSFSIYSLNKLLKWKTIISMPSVLILFLFSISIINLYQFNKIFILKHNENLGYFTGLSQIRDLIQNEIGQNEKNLLILDWRWGETFNIDRVTLLQGKFQYDVLSNLGNRFQSYLDFKKSLADGTYNTIYAIVPGPMANTYDRTSLLGGPKRYHFSSGNVFIPDCIYPHNTYQIVRSRTGNPIFYVHKITKRSDWQHMHVRPGMAVEVSLKPRHYIDHLYMPGIFERIDIICDRDHKKITARMPSTTHHYIYYSFHENSVLEIYNILSTPRPELILSDTIKPLSFNTQVGTDRLVATAERGSIQLNYGFVYPLLNILYSFNYVFYHDRDRINHLSLLSRTTKYGPWSSLQLIRSKGTERYGGWVWLPPHDLLGAPDSPLKYVDVLAGCIETPHTQSIDLKLDLNKRRYGYPYGIQILNKRYSPPIYNPNFIIATLDATQKESSQAVKKFGNNIRIIFHKNTNQPSNNNLVKVTLGSKQLQP